MALFHGGFLVIRSTIVADLFFIPTVSRSLSILGEEENTHTYNKQLNIARPVRVVLGLRNKSDLETCRAEW